MSASLIRLNFNLNKDFILKTLCVNRNDKDSSCAGKCFLAKKLKKDQRKKNHNNPLQSNSQEITWFFLGYLKNSINFVETIELRNSLFWNLGLTFEGFIDQLDFPPEILKRA